MADREPDEIHVPASARRLMEPFEDLLRETLKRPDVTESLDRAQTQVACFRALAEGDERRNDVLEGVVHATFDFAQAIGEASPELIEAFGRHGLVDICFSFLSPDGELLFPLRARAVPGYEGRPLWLLQRAADVEAFKRYVAPGQVWVDVSELTGEQFRNLWGLVSAQQQMGLGRRRKRAGRAKGSPSGPRQEFVEVVRQHPDWTAPQIYEAAVARGLRDDAYNENPETNRQWVRRLRRDAGVPRGKPGR